MSVAVYDPSAERIEADCKPPKAGKDIWMTYIQLPSKDLHYIYTVELGPKSSWAVVRKLKEMVVSSTPYKETKFRNLPKNFVVCRDVFEPPSGIDMSTISMYSGLINGHLQDLVDSLKSINDLKQKLLELQHLSRAFSEQLYQDSKAVDHLRMWIKQPFVSNAALTHKLVLLSVLYGTVADDLHIHLAKFSNMSMFLYKKILGALETVERGELTKWSITKLRVTVLHALEAAKQNHWIYAAAHFPYLFEVSRIMELSQSMDSGKFDMNALESKLIPKIKEGYDRDEVDTLLHQLMKTAKTAKRKAELTQVIEKFTKPQPLITLNDTQEDVSKPEQETGSTVTSKAEVFTSGAWAPSGTGQGNVRT